MNRKNIVFRTLSSADFQAYKELRLYALNSSDARFFVATPTPEALRSDEDWKKVCTETCDGNKRGTSVAVGAFSQQQLIGSALAERWTEDPTNQSSYYRAVYIRQDFRMLKVSAQLEKLLNDWSIENGYKKAIYTIRTSKKEWLQRYTDRMGATIKRECILPYVNGDRAHTYYLERPLKNHPTPDANLLTSRVA